VKMLPGRHKALLKDRVLLKDSNSCRPRRGFLALLLATTGPLGQENLSFYLSHTFNGLAQDELPGVSSSFDAGSKL